MGFAELFLIAVGLSMDAFAASVCTGLTMSRATIKKAFTVGLYFGIFQAVMPVCGYILATRFSDKITAYDHWITFILLCFIGGKMIAESLKEEKRPDMECGGSFKTEDTSSMPGKMLPLAVATSIDALAVGVSFAFLKVNIIPAALTIGVTTLVLSMLGVKVGNVFGMRFKSKAELAGGVILVFIGFKILFEHMGFLGMI